MKTPKIHCLGYLGIWLDIIISNAHYLYAMDTADNEWYVSDVAQAARIALWVIIVAFNAEMKAAQFITVLWYVLNILWDLTQIAAKTDFGDPSTELSIFLAGAIIIHLFIYNRKSNVNPQPSTIEG